MRTLVIVCLAAAVALAGCSHKQSFSTSQGQTTVETNNNSKTVSVSTNQGKIAFDANVDTSQLGLPVYPGATKNEGGISGTTAQGSGQVVALSTSDSFDKVYAWYRSHLPAGSQTMHMSGQTGSMAAFQIGKSSDKEQRSVVITADKDKTSILLSHNIKQ